MSYRSHQVKISATPQAGISIHGLTDHELHLIQSSLLGRLNGEDNHNDAKELDTLIRKALDRKYPERDASQMALEQVEKAPASRGKAQGR